MQNISWKMGIIGRVDNPWQYRMMEVLCTKFQNSVRGLIFGMKEELLDLNPLRYTHHIIR